MNLDFQPYSDTYEADCLSIIKRVIVDGFIESGINIQIEKSHLENELNFQFNRFRSNANRYILAIQNSKVIGMIAYVSPCEAVGIVAESKGILINNIQEIAAVYVHPDYQRLGIGSKLFTHMRHVLKKKQILYFAVSTGYLRGKHFWTKKLGEAIYTSHVL